MTETAKHDERSYLGWAIAGVGILMIFYHLLSVWTPLFDALLHQNVHLGFAFVLLFLVAMKQSEKWMRLLFGLALLASLAIVIYMHVEKDRLDMWAGFPEGLDVVIGIALVALIFFLTWKSWGSVSGRK